MSEGLKPCPFCGTHTLEIRTVPGELWIRCQACGAAIPGYDEKAEAFAAWNRRALPEQVRVLVAALEDIKTHSVPPFNTVRWCAYSNFVATEALKDFKGIPAFPEEKPDHVA